MAQLIEADTRLQQQRAMAAAATAQVLSLTDRVGADAAETQELRNALMDLQQLSAEHALGAFVWGIECCRGKSSSSWRRHVNPSKQSQILIRISADVFLHACKAFANKCVCGQTLTSASASASAFAFFLCLCPILYPHSHTTIPLPLPPSFHPRTHTVGKLEAELMQARVAARTAERKCAEHQRAAAAAEEAAMRVQVRADEQHARAMAAIAGMCGWG